jgi:hypothetical protein
MTALALAPAPAPTPTPMTMTALALALATMTAPGRVTRPALVAARMTPAAPAARMTPAAPAARVPAAQFRVAPAVLARIYLIVVRAGARVRFPVIGVTRVTVVAVARLAAREVTGGRRAWLLTTRRLVTGRLAGRPGLAGALARGPPGRITPDRPAVPAPKARPRTQPQTRNGQTRPVLIQSAAVTVIRGCLALGRPAGTVHSVMACPALAPARRAGTRPENRTTCRR